MPEPWDAFLSYSGVDNDAPPGWVRKLYSDLNARLLAVAPRLGAKIWFALEHLPAHGDLHDHIDKVLADARILLCVVSPSYVANNESLYEIARFLEQDHVGEPKILKVVKLPPGEDQVLPEPLPGARGYDLHNGVPRRARELTGERRDEAISDLAYELRDLVEAARRPPLAKVLLLAGPGREADRDRGLVELRLKGYQVMPAWGLPISEDQHAQALQKYVDIADFTVLLFGQRFSKDLQTVFDRLDNDLPDTRPVRCLSSVTVETSDDPLLGPLLQRANTPRKKSFDRVLHPDWVTATLEQLDALRDALRKPTVYLRYAPEQLEAVRRVRHSIPDQFDVLDPYAKQNTNPARVESQGYERAHGILVFAAAEDLLARTLNELRKAARSIVGVYVGAMGFNLSPALALNHNLVFPDAVPSDQLLPIVPNQAVRRFSLQEFLRCVQQYAADRS